MEFFKSDENGDSGGKITLEEALKEIEELPALEEYAGAFIEFINDKNESIQFVREKENDWLIDVTILEGGKFSYSLQDDGLTTEKVKDIVKKFPEEDWKSLCSLTRV